MGVGKVNFAMACLIAIGCFLYAYGIETQEFICSFGASDRNVPELGLVIIGLGRVGRKLLEEMMETTMTSKTNTIEPIPGGPRFRILCLADSTATVCQTKPFVEPVTVDTGGFDARGMASVLHHKQEERLPLRSFHYAHGRQALFRDALSAIQSMPHHLPAGGHIVVVDLSGSGHTGPALVAARKAGFGSVVANKLALAGSQEMYDDIKGPHMWHEAVLGGAVPMVQSLRRLLVAGDKLHKIEGVLSGTIEFVLAELHKRDPATGQPLRTLSEACAEAVRRGYSESDPREDFSGLDVARKALVIARMQDWQIELEDLDWEAFLSLSRGGSDVADLTAKHHVADGFNAERGTGKFSSEKHREENVAEWLEPGSTVAQSLVELDAAWAERVAGAMERGKVLRYVFSMVRTTEPHTPGQMWHNRPKEEGYIEVKLREVDPNSQLGALQGTDNVLVIESDLFKDGQELLLHGPGAGVARTVAAVKADLFFCAMEMPRHHVIGANHLW